MNERRTGSESGGTDPVFDERQSLPSWVGPVLGVLSAPALLIAAIAVVESSGLTVEAARTLALLALVVLGPIALVRRASLRTTVSEDGICFRFSPFHRTDRSVSFGDVTEVRRSERRAYQYGLRRTRWGWEYRPNAASGVEIYRENGPAIFLGSKRPHELREAIEEGIRRYRT